MCGILGAWQRSPFPFARLKACLRLLDHRGPDSSGAVGLPREGGELRTLEPNEKTELGLGHTRLAILDLSSLGAQPMRFPGGAWIIYNGEIYNYVELRKELEQEGVVFKTRTDTEVVLAAYDRWGVECVGRFNGMWAFAIYDPQRQSLFLSRDRLGIKPFYYRHEEGSCFHFASEIKALLSFGERKAAIAMERLADALVNQATDDGETTLYDGIRELRGGHSAWLDLAAGTFRQWRYWQLPEYDDATSMTDEATLDTFEALLEDAVRIRLRADVPIALTLSGGIDSSAIALATSRVSNGQVRTFTSRFGVDASIDETAYAERVAQATGAKANFVEADLEEIPSLVTELIYHQELPIFTLSPLMHWLILREVAGQGYPVVLAGQGGDELFLGYERYYVWWIWSQAFRPLRALRRFRDAANHSRLSYVELASFLAYFRAPMLQQWRHQARARQIFQSHFAALSKYHHRFSLASDTFQRHDLVEGSLPRLLRYDDRNSSAHGMETRLPFLDYRLVEFACRLPWKHKIREGWTKWIVRKYLERHGLEDIAWRRKKLGFDVPSDTWVARIWEERKGVLEKDPFCSRLIRPVAQLEKMPASRRWIVINLLELAAQFEWDTPDA